MTREEFLKIVQEENLLNSSIGLTGYIKKEPGTTDSENTYGWVLSNGKWCPYETDEKAFMVMFGRFDTEAEALERLLLRMRRRKDIAQEDALTSGGDIK